MTVLALLVLPTVIVPKFKLLADSVTGALPEPERLTVCDPASSVNVRVPVMLPTAVGKNVTPTLQLAPAATVVPQLLAATKKLALATTLDTPRDVLL